MARFDESALDPELVARLRERFGDPPARPAPAVDPALEEVRRRRDLAAAHADPGLLNRLEAQGRRAEGPRMAPAEVRVDPGIARLDLKAWSLSEVGDPVWYEPPEAIREALKQAAPQALLRDLHRPVLHFGEVALRPSLSSHDPTGQRAREVVRTLMRRDFRARPAEHQHASRLGAIEIAALRALLREPWERAAPEEGTGVPRSMPGPEDAQWFGIQGGYDPDQ